jgi:hypothetical protein
MIAHAFHCKVLDSPLLFVTYRNSSYMLGFQHPTRLFRFNCPHICTAYGFWHLRFTLTDTSIRFIHMVQILFLRPSVCAMLLPPGFMRTSAGRTTTRGLPGSCSGLGTLRTCARHGCRLPQSQSQVRAEAVVDVRTLPTPALSPLLRARGRSVRSSTPSRDDASETIFRTLPRRLSSARQSTPFSTNIVRVLWRYSGFWSTAGGTDERGGWVGLSIICFPCSLDHPAWHSRHLHHAPCVPVRGARSNPPPLSHARHSLECLGSLRNLSPRDLQKTNHFCVTARIQCPCHFPRRAASSAASG